MQFRTSRAVVQSQKHSALRNDRSILLTVSIYFQYRVPAQAVKRASPLRQTVYFIVCKYSKRHIYCLRFISTPLASCLPFFRRISPTIKYNIIKIACYLNELKTTRHSIQIIALYKHQLVYE